MIGPIRSRAVFRAFDRGADRRRSGPLTLVRARPGPGVPVAEGVGLAFAVSRRVGPAVVRNRLRRQLRAAIDEIDRSTGVASGWYLVVVHPGADGTPFPQLRAALADALAGLPRDREADR